MWFAYDGETDPTLHFRLFAPDRLREAAIGTGWEVEAVDREGTGDGPHYRAAPGSGRCGAGSGSRDRPPYHAVSAARPWSCARIARNARTPVIANAPPT